MLQEQVPAEASVWWLLAKVHKRLGHKSRALTALNAALDLQPPAADAALIKAALDKLHLHEVRSWPCCCSLVPLLPGSSVTVVHLAW